MANHKIYADAMLRENWEGGLSRALTDTASSDPCPMMYQGKTGWHTNKGITWTTFKSNGHLGYNPTPENFFLMPHNIWTLIYKKSYWDVWHLDEMKYQSIANILVSWAWGSGATGSLNMMFNFVKNKMNYSGAKTRKDVMKFLDSQPNERALFNLLCDERERLFVAMNQPANLQGWKNRLNRFRALFEPKDLNPLFFFALIVLARYLYNKLKKKR